MPRASPPTKVLRDIANLEDRYCEDCDQVFSRAAELKRHLRTTLQHNPDAMIYSCKYCDRCFAQKCNLDIHERIHLGDQAEHCGLPSGNEICSHRCSDPGSMLRHIKRVHFGPYITAKDPIPAYLQAAYRERQEARCQAKLTARRARKAQNVSAPKPLTSATHATTPSQELLLAPNAQIPIPSCEISALFREHQYPAFQAFQLPRQLLQIADVHPTDINNVDTARADAQHTSELSGWSGTTAPYVIQKPFHEVSYLELALDYTNDRAAEVPLSAPEQSVVVQGLDAFTTGNHLYSSFCMDSPASDQQSQISSGSLNIEDFTPYIDRSSDGINMFPDVASGTFPEIPNYQSTFDDQLVQAWGNGNATSGTIPPNPFTFSHQGSQPVQMELYDFSYLSNMYPTEYFSAYDPAHGCVDIPLPA